MSASKPVRRLLSAVSRMIGWEQRRSAVVALPVNQLARPIKLTICSRRCLMTPEVREGRASQGLHIPPDTLSLGALHDTTTDDVTLYTDDYPSAAHRPDLERAQAWLAAAGKLARSRRALRLPRAGNEATIHRRARHWAEVRPEWALAGCKAFVAAPRVRTAGKDFQGGAFLHDYDWRTDKEFGVLELIMTAPVVVASWISLQYYGSTVAPDTFGGGNKLLHNVTGGMGVVEGNGGLLPVGLPWQSVHDGQSHVHEPLRLTVGIEAPREAMTNILSRHDTVRALFDNPGCICSRSTSRAG